MPRPTSLPSQTPTRYAGLGDGFTKAFEFALTPAIFCGLGWLVDKAFGTKPLFMIVLTVFAIVGSFLRLWYTYDATMKIEQERTITARAEADRQRDDAVQPAFEIAEPTIVDYQVVNHGISNHGISNHGVAS